MRVLVTGATGRLGRVLVPRLVEAGHSVRAMSRTARTGDGVEWVRADLATGEGVAEATASVGTVVHLASAPYQRGYTRQVDVTGTERLVAAAGEAGVGHLLYVSIVGIDRVPWSYFKVKLEAERLVLAGGVPCSVVRATQFHCFLDEIVDRLSRLPVLVVDPRILGQPIDASDVAEHIVGRLAARPSNAIEDFGGPEVLRADRSLRDWLNVRRIRRALLRVRVPGKLGRSLRSGALTTTAQPSGRITWREYLAETYGEPERGSTRP